MLTNIHRGNDLCSGAFRVVYMTPEYSTRAKKLLEDIIKKVGESCIKNRVLLHYMYVKVTITS